jgi:D-alanyl-D-alanine carboxypeptidase/D-alanyl-D-alanine-endopeptidase (penicillin-binding protein 4)
VLVGGGDPLLASKPLTLAEAESTYPARADVTTLALAAAEALGGSGRVRVRFDDSLFTGPTDNPAWRRDYVPDDIVSPITALMVDGGDEPDSDLKQDEPSLAAARVFSDALRAAGLRVAGEPRRTVAPAAAEELASAESAPLAEIAERILDVSDNEGSEVVAHQVGLATSGTGSFESGAAGVLDTLAGLGIDVSRDEVYDGSGLSRRNRVATSTLIGLLQHAAGPEGEAVRSLLTGMPVAGFTGSLTYRFAEGPPVARGMVRAKTGTLTGVHALAGIAVGRDGVPMAFVLGADRSPPEERYDAQEALDRAAAALAACRCSTSVVE